MQNRRRVISDPIPIGGAPPAGPISGDLRPGEAPKPVLQGAILADEVGLGKTVEAGLLLAQKWAERKRRLVSTPSVFSSRKIAFKNSSSLEGFSAA